MKILFLQFGSKYYSDGKRFFTDGSLNNKIWNRYLTYSDKLTVIGKAEQSNGNSNINYDKLNEVPKEINLVLVKDLYNPKKNYVNLKLRKLIKNQIIKEIESNDYIVIRSITNDYNLFAANYCIKHKKEFIVEVTGFGFDSLWYHDGILGKIMAVIVEKRMRCVIKKCPNVLYVTNKALQERYKNHNYNVGCSDVEIEIDYKDLENRLKKIEKNKKNKRIVIGTIGPIDSKLKGQEHVIKAISKLNNEYNYEFYYELVGRGEKDYLYQFVKKYKVEKYVNFIGELPHNKIFDWIDNIDIYIQPSFQEGLCRALVEAMSRGCPVLSSNAGGNNELVNKNNIFKKGKYEQIIKILKKIDYEFMVFEANRGFEEAKKFDREILNKTRNDFYEKCFSTFEGVKK